MYSMSIRINFLNHQISNRFHKSALNSSPFFALNRKVSIPTAYVHAQITCAVNVKHVSATNWTSFYESHI